MAIFEKYSRPPKTINAIHYEPGDFRLGYILLPMGYAYNTQWKDAKTGDILRLFNGGDYKIVSVRKLNLKKPEADLLCRIRYGITIKAAVQRWKRNATIEGHGPTVVSDEECYWIIYETGETEEE